MCEKFCTSLGYLFIINFIILVITVVYKWITLSIILFINKKENDNGVKNSG